VCSSDLPHFDKCRNVATIKPTVAQITKQNTDSVKVEVKCGIKVGKTSFDSSKIVEGAKRNHSSTEKVSTPTSHKTKTINTATTRRHPLVNIIVIKSSSYSCSKNSFVNASSISKSFVIISCSNIKSFVISQRSFS